MVAMRNGAVVPVPLAEATASQRTVPPDHEMVRAARAVGTSFGDA